MDPYSVLGLDPGASDDEAARAYRELAKRWHPDRAGDDGERMAELNAAYDLLRAGLIDQQTDRLAEQVAEERTRIPGSWLAPDIRRSLGAELVAALETGEDVLIAVDAATRDSHDVRLAVTDRRLLWLRDDAISDRVRYQRFERIAGLEARPPQRLRRTGELRVRLATGRRLSFGELQPSALESLVGLLCGRLRFVRGA